MASARLRRAPTLLVSAGLLHAGAQAPTTPPAQRATLPRVERVREIGCADCDGPRRFGEIYDVAITPDGVVLVVTGDAPMLRVFDRDGNPKRTGVRPGAGPGELLLPIRGALAADGSVHVVDMRLRRVMHLAPDLRLLGSRMLGQFPAAVAARAATGELIILTDDFRGTRTLERWSPDGDSAHVIGRSPPDADETSGAAVSMHSIAVSGSGAIAVSDGARYRIMRLGPAGDRLPDIARDVPRVRRTPAEQAEVEERLRAGPGHAAAERRATTRAGGGGRASVLPPGDAALTFKPHVARDALRYDDAGRLWVLTMRGDEHGSVFDLFDPRGSFLGEVRLETRVQAFALAGGWLATSGENADGVPVVTTWVVR